MFARNTAAIFAGIIVVFIITLTLKHNALQSTNEHRKRPSVAHRHSPPQHHAHHEKLVGVEHLRKAKYKEYPRRLFTYLNASQSAYNTRVGGEAQESGNGQEKHCPNCFRIVSLHPRVAVFDNMVTKDEAAELIKSGEKLLTRSGVVSSGHTSRTRTSSGARLTKGEKLVDEVDKRLLDAVNHFTASKSEREFKAGNAERLYLLRYQGNEKYNGHPDHFGGIDGPLMKNFRKKNKKAAKQQHHEGEHSKHGGSGGGQSKLDRAATFLIYLSDLPEGYGTTSFPYSSKDHSMTEDVDTLESQLTSFDPKRHSPCAANSSFIQLTPKIGTAVLFYDLFENGVADPFSMHAGCPVGTDQHNATKWLVTKWFMLPLT